MLLDGKTLPCLLAAALAVGIGHCQEAELSPEELHAKHIARGEKVFRKCKACHSVGAGAVSKVGPVLNGVVGRKIAGLDAFKYSAAFIAFRDKGAVWTKKELDKYLFKPKKHINGTAMNFIGLRKEKDRMSVIAYLESFNVDGEQNVERR